MGRAGDRVLVDSVARREEARDEVALLLPRLDSVTRTEWLLYGMKSSLAEYGSAIAGLVLYAAVITAAGLFDFQRRSL